VNRVPRVSKKRGGSTPRHLTKNNWEKEGRGKKPIKKKAKNGLGGVEGGGVGEGGKKGPQTFLDEVGGERKDQKTWGAICRGWGWKGARRTVTEMDD